MQNIATVYRFNTPFLDIQQEKNSLIKVVEKINNFLIDDGLNVTKKENLEGIYYVIIIDFGDDLGKIYFSYINKLSSERYLPIFKMDIFLNISFLNQNYLKKTTTFLTALFECFDGLNEKEYLIEINKNIFYTKGIFSSKIYPYFDFACIDEIEKDFENKNGIKLLEEFISMFKNKSFLLTPENAEIYHQIHHIILYYIYLVYFMYKSISQASNTIKSLDSINIENEHLTLSKIRLEYINNLSITNFKKYLERLEIFFKLFD